MATHVGLGSPWVPDSCFVLRFGSGLDFDWALVGDFVAEAWTSAATHPGSLVAAVGFVIARVAVQVPSIEPVAWINCAQPDGPQQ